MSEDVLFLLLVPIFKVLLLGIQSDHTFKKIQMNLNGYNQSFN